MSLKWAEGFFHSLFISVNKMKEHRCHLLPGESLTLFRQVQIILEVF